jgi:hypothetical protein
MDTAQFSDVWALIDSNADIIQPRGEFTNGYSKCYLIQATSPQPERYKVWRKQLGADLAVMNEWSWEETYIAWLVFGL